MDESKVPPPVYDKLPLESALDETPEITSLVKVFTEDAKSLQDYVVTLHQISSQLVAAHNKLTSTYQDLSRHLNNYTFIKKNSCDNDPDGILSTSLKKFSDIVSEMSSWEHILATQIADGVVYPLSKFIDTDLQELNTLDSMYQAASNEIDRSVGRYSRSRRKDPRQERIEAAEDVYKARKNFHQLSLEYYSRLNQLQIGRQLALLQPILGFTTASRGHHQLGHEALSSGCSDDFLSGIGVTLKGLSSDLRKEKVETLELINSMVSQSQLMYCPEPPGELANLPPDTTLSSKSGYLNIHRKYMGVMSSWERQFIFIEGGNLMSVPKGEIGGTLLLELDATTFAHASDTDDRLHVFTVSSAKKSVILQALNDRERDEWMLIIQKLAKEGSYVKCDKMVQQSSLLSGVGQFFADKFQAASAAVGGGTVVAASPPSSPSAKEPTTPPVSKTVRGEVIPKDAPIVFDILSADEEEEEENVAHKVQTVDESSPTGSNLEDKEFSVRFLGSMRVNVDAVESFLVGQSVVFEVMRRILAARAIHNMFTTSHLHLVVSSKYLTLRDVSSKSVRIQHRLKDIAYWAVHSENQRLVGYIVRQIDNGTGSLKEGSFSCFVFESDDNGKNICSALGSAARSAYAHLLDKKTQQEKKKEEMKILLDNIATLPDKDGPPQLSSDGNYLVLDSEVPQQIPSPTRRNLPVREKKHDSEA